VPVVLSSAELTALTSATYCSLASSTVSDQLSRLKRLATAEGAVETTAEGATETGEAATARRRERGQLPALLEMKGKEKKRRTTSDNGEEGDKGARKHN
jgi:hypothetical protein